jgi:hypothetical protein
MTCLHIPNLTSVPLPLPLPLPVPLFVFLYSYSSNQDANTLDGSNYFHGQIALLACGHWGR